MTTEDQGTNYQPGDQRNGYILGTDGQWHPEAQPAPTPTKQNNNKLIAGLVGGAGILLLGIILVGIGAGLANNSDSDNSNSDAPSTPAPTVTVEPEPVPEPDGYDTAMTFLEIAWLDMSSREQDNICKSWNLGLDDVFVKSFMDSAGPEISEFGITRNDLEVAVRDFFDAEC